MINSYPDNAVPVSYYKSAVTSGTSPSYFKLSGTSIATPTVSSAAALLVEQDSMTTPGAVKARLM